MAGAGYSLETSSSSSASGQSRSGFDNSGFTVNIGKGSLTTGAMPSWVVIAGVVVVVWLLYKQRK